jgi:hypothetical protein
VKAPKEIKSQLRQMGLVLDTRYLLISSPKCFGISFWFLALDFWFPSHYSTSVFTVGPEKLPPTAEIQPRARKEIKGEWFPDVSRDSEECSLVSVRVYEVLRGYNLKRTVMRVSLREPLVTDLQSTGNPWMSSR